MHSCKAITDCSASQPKHDQVLFFLFFGNSQMNQASRFNFFFFFPFFLFSSVRKHRSILWLLIHLLISSHSLWFLTVGRKACYNFLPAVTIRKICQKMSTLFSCWKLKCKILNMLRKRAVFTNIIIKKD